MTKVYILRGVNRIFGVYSSLEKANTEKEKLETPDEMDGAAEDGLWIESYEVW